MAWRVIRLTEILGRRADYSFKVRILAKRGPQSHYKRELMMVCRTHSSIVAHYLYY